MGWKKIIKFNFGSKMLFLCAIVIVSTEAFKNGVDIQRGVLSRQLLRKEASVVPLTKASEWGRFEHLQSRGLRLMPVALGGVWVLRPEALDGLVASVWQSLYALPFAHNNMFEACVASFGFLWAIIFWSSLHKILWPKKEYTRFRIDRQPPVATFEWLGQLGPKRMFGAWLPLITYLASIWLFHLFVSKPPLPLAPPSFLRLFIEVTFGIIAYDLLFQPIHATLHSSRSPYWWRKLHRMHHEARPPQRSGKALAPLETVQHSYIDGLLQVFINIFVQKMAVYRHFSFATLTFGPLVPKHPLSRILHNLFVTYLLVEAHSGYDLPWMTHRTWPKVFAGSPAHNAHHLSGATNYHQFFHSFRFPPWLQFSNFFASFNAFPRRQKALVI